MHSSIESVPQWLRAYTDSLESGEPLAKVVAVEARRRGLPESRTEDPGVLARLLAEHDVPLHRIAAAVGLSNSETLDLTQRVSPDAGEIVEMHAQGYTPLEIAREKEIGRGVVYYHLNRRGLSPHRKNKPELTARQRTQIEKAFKLGEPISGIARRFQVSEAQVRYAVRNEPRT